MVLEHGDAEQSLRAGEDTRTTRSQVRRAAAASAIGTTIEWYDFFLYNTASALIFPALFFPASSEYAGIMQSFGTYAVGFVARPIGAAIFGYWGDRLGRKTTLIITLLLMGIASGIIGVLPGAGTIGLWAPLLLVLLRVVQGIAVGGEWSGSVLLTMEWGAQGKRGFFGSFAQVGVPIGLVVGTGGMTLVSSVMDPESFASWGWRLPFLFSLVLVAIGLVIRLSILETPMFARVIAEKRTARKPVTEAIRKHPKEILLSAGLRFSEQLPFYLFSSFVLTYLEDQGFSKSFALTALMVAAAFELITIPLFSAFSDRFGRKRIYAIGAVGIIVIAAPYFAVLDNAGPVAVFAMVIISFIPHALHYGPQAALISESFPTRLRYGGAGLGYQLASVFAGGPAPLLATFLLHETMTPYAISGLMVFTAIVTLICLWLLPDRSRADIDDESLYRKAIR